MKRAGTTGRPAIDMVVGSSIDTSTPVAVRDGLAALLWKGDHWQLPAHRSPVAPRYRVVDQADELTASQTLSRPRPLPTLVGSCSAAVGLNRCHAARAH